MSATHGQFVWYELMTTDVAAAKSFYGHVLGWGSQPSGVADMEYTLCTAADVPVAGMMDLPPPARQAGVPPNWIGYVGVDNVDEAVKQASGLGAHMHCPPTDIPGVGRFAAISDPQGASLAVFKASDSGMGAPAGPGVPGHVGWHELMAVDLQTAFPFYASMFGWRKGDAVEMGAMGVYQLFIIETEPIGGMFTKPPMVPVPAWTYYFVVEDIDAAVARVAEAGGATVNGPMQVPGGDWIAQCRDPQGAMFAMVCGSR